MGARALSLLLGWVAACSALFPNTCDLCCLGRGQCSGLSTVQHRGTCCPFRTRCCLTGSTSQIGAYSCCSGSELCLAVPSVPGEQRCSIPVILPVATVDSFHCPVCCLGQGNCATVQTTAGSCCEEGDSCCLVGDIPRMPGAYTCCRSSQVCARVGLVANAKPQCRDVERPAPVCDNCCLGDGKCDGLTKLAGKCCAADETCCRNGGDFVCCKTNAERCVVSDSGAGSCTARQLRPTPAPVTTLCDGLPVLSDPVHGTSIGCGIGQRMCPGPNSYCDTKHVFPRDPYRGVCCPSSQLNTCAKHDSCKDCAGQGDGCVWVQEGSEFCHHSCPKHARNCLSSRAECPKPFSWVLGSCWRRCGEIGLLRAKASSSARPGAMWGPRTSSWARAPRAGPNAQICSCDYMCRLVGDCCDDYDVYCMG